MLRLITARRVAGIALVAGAIWLWNTPFSHEVLDRYGRGIFALIVFAFSAGVRLTPWPGRSA